MSQTKRVALNQQPQTAQTGCGSLTERPLVSIAQVEPIHLQAVWPSIQKQLRNGLTRACGDRLTEEGLINAILGERMELWVAIQDDEVLAGLVLQLVKRPRGRAVVVVAMAGKNFHTWSDAMYHHLRGYMVSHECYCVEAIVRAGLTKWLHAYGWRSKATVMEMT